MLSILLMICWRFVCCRFCWWFVSCRYHSKQKLKTHFFWSTDQAMTRIDNFLRLRIEIIILSDLWQLLFSIDVYFFPITKIRDLWKVYDVWRRSFGKRYLNFWGGCIHNKRAANAVKVTFIDYKENFICYISAGF